MSETREAVYFSLRDGRQLALPKKAADRIRGIARRRGVRVSEVAEIVLDRMRDAAEGALDAMERIGKLEDEP